MWKVNLSANEKLQLALKADEVDKLFTVKIEKQMSSRAV
jgi:hypothetical protein